MVMDGDIRSPASTLPDAFPRLTATRNLLPNGWCGPYPRQRVLVERSEERNLTKILAFTDAGH